MRIYVEFARYDVAGVKTNFDPYAIGSVTTKRGSNDTVQESGLSLVKTTEYKSSGHYYLTIAELNYDPNIPYYMEFLVTYINGFTAKTIKKYFTTKIVAGTIVQGPVKYGVDTGGSTCSNRHGLRCIG